VLVSGSRILLKLGANGASRSTPLPSSRGGPLCLRQERDAWLNSDSSNPCALAGLLIAGSYARAQVCTWSTVSSSQREPQVSFQTLLSVLAPSLATTSGPVGYNLLYPNTPTYHTLTEHWDGSQWAIIPSPNQDSSQLYGVAAAGRMMFWAVGTSTQGSIAYCVASNIGIGAAGQRPPRVIRTRLFMRLR